MGVLRDLPIRHEEEERADRRIRHSDDIEEGGENGYTDKTN